MKNRAAIFGTAAIAVIAVTAVLPRGASAQAVYRCSAHAYSQAPCSDRVVRDVDAPLDRDVRPRAVVAHRLPGETLAQFNLRKRRSGLTDSDRDECARLDTRIPLEQERIKSGVEEEIVQGQAALDASHRRAKKLGC